MRNFKIHRWLGPILMAGAIVSTASAGFAEGTTSLFKIVTVRDEIIVALSAEDIAKIGGNDVTRIGQAIKAGGELTVWQYAVRKGNDGALEQAPLKRISLIGHDSLRVEPYASPLRIIPAN